MLHYELDAVQAVTEEFHQFLEECAEHTSLGSTVLHINISITVWEQTLLSCTLFGILWRSAFVCASTGGMATSAAAPPLPLAMFYVCLSLCKRAATSCLR